LPRPLNSLHANGAAYAVGIRCVPAHTPGPAPRGEERRWDGLQRRRVSFYQALGSDSGRGKNREGTRNDQRLVPTLTSTLIDETALEIVR